MDRCRKNEDPVRVSPHSLTLFLSLSLYLSVPLFLRAESPESAAIEVGPQKQLFLDDYLVASSTNIFRRIHPAEKSRSNPVIRQTEPWEDPFTVPRTTVLALAGSDPARWPPSPLAERQLWEHSARGQLADVSALVARRTGHAFWIPAAAHSAGRPHAPGGHVVVTERLGTADCWLPAGVYAGQQALLDGLPVPPARQLLALPGVTDLASGTPQPAATVQAACSPYETSPG